MFESAHNLEGNGAVLPLAKDDRSVAQSRARRTARARVLRRAEYGLPFRGRPECRALHARLGTSVAAAEERARRAEAIAHALERWGARAALSPRVSRPPGGRPFF